MKLYARLHNSTRKVEGMGDKDKLYIELTQGNRVVAEITFIENQLEIWYHNNCERYFLADLSTGDTYPKGKQQTGDYAISDKDVIRDDNGDEIEQ